MFRVQIKINDDDELLVKQIKKAKNKSGKIKELARLGADRDDYIRKINDENLKLKCQLEDSRRSIKELHERIDGLNDNIRTLEQERHNLTENVWQLKNRLMLMQGALKEFQSRSLWGRLINKKPIFELPEGDK